MFCCIINNIKVVKGEELEDATLNDINFNQPKQPIYEQAMEGKFQMDFIAFLCTKRLKTYASFIYFILINFRVACKFYERNVDVIGY